MKLKTKLFCIWAWLFVLMQTNPVNAQPSIPTDTLHQNTTWSADSIIIKNKTLIPEGITLTIEPGANILAEQTASFEVFGNIVAIGSEDQPITFGVIDTNDFSKPYTRAGGWLGFLFHGNQSIQDSSIFEYCILSNGKAIDTFHRRNGGLMQLDSFRKLVLVNSIVKNNYANASGGALTFGENSYARIENCVFEKNKAEIRGGAIHCWTNSNPNISQNVFYGNNCLGLDTLASGIYLTGNGSCIATSSIGGQAPLILNNIFFNNIGLATIWESCENILIVGNLITNNYGSGILNATNLSNSIYANNTICNHNYGGIGILGLVINSKRIKLINNVIYNNFHYAYKEDIKLVFPNAQPLMIHNYLPGDWDDYGYGNSDEVPFFSNPSQVIGHDPNVKIEDWLPGKRSPLIDAGSLDSLTNLLPDFDFLGKNRIMGSTIDIGALEYDPTSSGIDVINPDFPCKIYPNPFVNNFWLEPTQTTTAYKVQITDLNGKLMLEKEIQGLTAFNLSTFNSGPYFVKITDEKTGEACTQKVLKIK